MLTPSLGALELDLPPFSPSEFLDMYSFQDVVLPSDEDVLEDMVKIDSPIVNSFYPQDGIPYQQPSFPSNHQKK